MRAAHRIRVPDSNPVVLEIHLQQPAEEIQRGVRGSDVAPAWPAAGENALAMNSDP